MNIQNLLDTDTFETGVSVTGSVVIGFRKRKGIGQKIKTDRFQILGVGGGVQGRENQNVLSSALQASSTICSVSSQLRHASVRESPGLWLGVIS